MSGGGDFERPEFGEAARATSRIGRASRPSDRRRNRQGLEFATRTGGTSEQIAEKLGFASSTIAWSCTASPSTAVADARLRCSRSSARPARRRAAPAFSRLPLRICCRNVPRALAWPPRFLAAAAGCRSPGARSPANRCSRTPCSWPTTQLARHPGLSGAPLRVVSKDNSAMAHPLARDQIRRSTSTAPAAARPPTGERDAATLEVPSRWPVPEGTTGPATICCRSARRCSPRWLRAAWVPRQAGGARLRACAREVGWYNESGKDNVLRVLAEGDLATTLHLLPRSSAARIASTWPIRQWRRSQPLLLPALRPLQVRAGWI